MKKLKHKNLEVAICEVCGTEFPRKKKTDARRYLGLSVRRAGSKTCCSLCSRYRHRAKNRANWKQEVVQ